MPDLLAPVASHSHIFLWVNISGNCQFLLKLANHSQPYRYILAPLSSCWILYPTVTKNFTPVQIA